MEDYKPIEEVTPEELLAEYAAADESYAVQNDEVVEEGE